MVSIRVYPVSANQNRYLSRNERRKTNEITEKCAFSTDTVSAVGSISLLGGSYVEYPKKKKKNIFKKNTRRRTYK